MFFSASKAQESINKSCRYCYVLSLNETWKLLAGGMVCREGCKSLLLLSGCYKTLRCVWDGLQWYHPPHVWLEREMSSPLTNSAKTLIYFCFLGTSGKTIHSKRERKTLLLKSWGENVLQISNMQLVSYQKQVCVCGTWTAGEGFLWYGVSLLICSSSEKQRKWPVLWVENALAWLRALWLSLV